MRTYGLSTIVTVVLLFGTALAGDIHDAVFQGNATRVIEMIDADSTAIHEANSQGMTPLQLAALTGNVEIIEILLNRGASLDDTHPVYGSLMNVAFIGACQRKGGPDAVLFLIDHAVPFDPMKIDALGMTPLDWAVQFNNIQLLRLAIDSGADINIISKRFGAPPLTTAIVKGYGELAAMLLADKADASILDNYGKPAIFYAVEQGRTSILHELLTYKAPVDFTESDHGRSLLHIAAIKGYRDVAELLVNYGAKINAADGSGNTPLYYANKYGNHDVADFLTKNGAKYSSTGPDESSQLVKVSTEVKTGNAQIRYLNHRGWLVRTENHTLVFDAEEFGVRRSDNPSLQNGFLIAKELAHQQVLALFSCYHGQPGEPAYIHTLADSLDDISFVHLTDDAWRGSPNTLYLRGRADTVSSDVSVRTISLAESMPELGYLCQADGLNIYFQAFSFENPDSLNACYSFLGQFVDSIDIAFLPIPEPDQENSDLQIFLQRFPTRAVVLVDSNRRVDLFPDVARRIASWGVSARVFCVQNPGDSFDF